jgi:GNAT superfamily N-acetyltransferase
MPQPMPETPVVRLSPDDAPRVVDALCDAFHDYPVMRFVLGERGDAYDALLHRLIGFFVAARALRREPLLGVGDGERLHGAAIMSFPGMGESPPELRDLRDAVWAEVGAESRARYEACGVAWAPLTVEVPHVHLNMIGVRSAHQGKGLSRKLLEAAHGISLATQGSQGITLTTEDPANVPYYEHMGYEVVGRARIAPGLETWGMFRRN